MRICLIILMNTFTDHKHCVRSSVHRGGRLEQGGGSNEGQDRGRRPAVQAETKAE